MSHEMMIKFRDHTGSEKKYLVTFDGPPVQYPFHHHPHGRFDLTINIDTPDPNATVPRQNVQATATCAGAPENEISVGGSLCADGGLPFNGSPHHTTGTMTWTVNWAPIDAGTYLLTMIAQAQGQTVSVSAPIVAQ
jgi:hypothetical protein